MNATALIPTDLVTPLGAYLRLRALGEASFLLESVEQGRLGRYSFVGCGSRLVSFDEAERETGPVVGYVGYDYVARYFRDLTARLGPVRWERFTITIIRSRGYTSSGSTSRPQVGQ